MHAADYRVLNREAPYQTRERNHQMVPQLRERRPWRGGVSSQHKAGDEIEGRPSTIPPDQNQCHPGASKFLAFLRNNLGRRRLAVTLLVFDNIECVSIRVQKLVGDQWTPTKGVVNVPLENVPEPIGALNAALRTGGSR